jgi:2-C-methyl-D-erythritol 4-phosphate cytidylyltransferase
MKKIAIIPSGGRGSRAKTSVPKQYLKFNGKELIAYTVSVFQNSPSIDEIIVSAEEEYFDLLNKIKQNFKFDKLKNLVGGGENRQESVYNALKTIDAEEDDIIAVHDAVRPLLPQDVLETAVSEAESCGSVVVAINAKDTLIKGGKFALDYIDREQVYYAQTPQIFSYKILLKSFQNAIKEGFVGTDESMIVKRSGYDVKIVDGSSINFKITTETDIQLFELISRHGGTGE